MLDENESDALRGEGEAPLNDLVSLGGLVNEIDRRLELYGLGDRRSLNGRELVDLPSASVNPSVVISGFVGTN